MTDHDEIATALSLEPPQNLPDWVPSAAQMYLAHTEAGLPIRALARAAGCHASTILRQIRKIETKRDDPLIDAALRNLGSVHFKPSQMSNGVVGKEEKRMNLQHTISPENTKAAASEKTQFEADAARVLRRLCETGAVLAVADNMEKAVIVRDAAGDAATRTGVVDRSLAEAMALKDWISPKQTGKITRYTITATGRTALETILQRETTEQMQGFHEGPADFSGRTGAWPERVEPEDRPRRMRYNFAESPLTALARRKDKNGEPFLSAELVSAGEQLREDFELAQMGPRITQNWESFLSAGGRNTHTPDSGVPLGSANARDRVAEALAVLGPGLGDVVLRCCCYLEGLETAEKKLGWSARSGKIVLRIALIRLKRHYDDTIGPGGPLIG